MALLIPLNNGPITFCSVVFTAARTPLTALNPLVTVLLAVPIFRAIAAAHLRSQGVRDSIISDRLYTSFHLHPEALFVLVGQTPIFG